jgi:ferric-dicitrate binding protein FerR (iron transport regulator)
MRLACVLAGLILSLCMAPRLQAQALWRAPYQTRPGAIRIRFLDDGRFTVTLDIRGNNNEQSP